MNSRRTFPRIRAAFAVIVAVLLTARVVALDSNTPLNVVVNFGDPDFSVVPPANHVLIPDDALVGKDGTVTYIVNGGGHGIAIYPVSDNTTRDDITAQLCAHVAGAPCGDPSFANGDVTIRDGKNDVIIMSGTNPPFFRLDDPTNRLLGTSTQIGTVVGAFLTGATPTASGTLLQVRFPKKGRYLAVCMNRSHFLNDWEFGFISVQ